MINPTILRTLNVAVLTLEGMSPAEIFKQSGLITTKELDDGVRLALILDKKYNQPVNTEFQND